MALYRKSFNTFNDGPGSGLDADTLDGSEASSFGLLNAAQTWTADQTYTGNANFQGEIQLNTSAGTSGQVLTSQGTGVDPIWSTPVVGEYFVPSTEPGNWNEDGDTSISDATDVIELVTGLQATLSYKSESVLEHPATPLNGSVYTDSKFAVKVLQGSINDLTNVAINLQPEGYGDTVIIGSTSPTAQRYFSSFASSGQALYLHADHTVNISGLALKVPTGDTASRPSGSDYTNSAAAGQLRFNTELNQFEGYDGTAWGTIGGSSIAEVATPTPIFPLAGATDVQDGVKLQASAYKHMFSDTNGNIVARAVRRFQLSASGAFSSIYEAAIDSDFLYLAYDMTDATQYQWRCRDEDVNGLVSEWSDPQLFTSASVQATTPTLLATDDSALSTSENEGTRFEIKIANYASTGIYRLAATDGTVTRSANIITWNLPLVTADTSNTIYVNFEDSLGRTAPTATHTLTVVNVAVTADAAIQVVNYSGNNRYISSDVTF